MDDGEDTKWIILETNVEDWDAFSICEALLHVRGRDLIDGVFFDAFNSIETEVDAFEHICLLSIKSWNSVDWIMETIFGQ